MFESSSIDLYKYQRRLRNRKKCSMCHHQIHISIIIGKIKLKRCSMCHQYINIRGLSQKVVDFLYNKKTIWSIAIKFYL